MSSVKILHSKLLEDEDMELASSVSQYTRKPERKQSFSRIVRALFKKTLITKVRKPLAIIELVLSCIVFIILFFMDLYGRQEFEGYEDPSMNYTSLFPVSLLAFFGATSDPTIVGVPDHPVVRKFINETVSLMYQLVPENMTSRFTLHVNYVNTTEEMENMIYAFTSNGMGLYWVNAQEDNHYTSPEIRLYHQSFSGKINRDMFEILYRYIALNQTKLSLAAANTSFQRYATIPTTEMFDIAIGVEFFMAFPVILATMADFQNILIEKDNRVQTLTFLMGCPETAYWLVSIVTQIILAIPPYLIMVITLCFSFTLVGSSVTLVLVLSLLFIIGQVMFQMFLSTFMKKASTGRIVTGVMLLLIVFFGYLHYFFTLDETNTSEGLKHLFSIVPSSAYQMFVMMAYWKIHYEEPPVSWSNITEKTVYPTWYCFLWLCIDIIVYTLLFIFFNLINKRDFGSPLLNWRDMFKLEAWKRVFKKYSDFEASKSSMLSENFIEVSNVSKTYHGLNDVVALQEVNFAIKAGEVIVMIGPNGAGKSTLMNILSGAIEPTTGELKLFGGHSTTKFTEIQQFLGVCFQDNVVISLLNIKEHFDLFGAIRGVPQDEIDDSLRFFAETLQLTEMIENRAGDLSGGQKRKLCIALSLLGSPPLVIMDEPTAGVDVQSRQLIWKTISALTDTTVLVTSHALEEAEAVSSRLFVVAGGGLKFSGTATELRNEFKCGYILRFDGPSEPILELSQKFVPESHMAEDRDDTIAMPVVRAVSSFLTELETRKEELKIVSFSFSVEQLEDVLMKLIEHEEAQYIQRT